MSCCNTEYLGVFCTDTNTNVFGFITFKDGVPTYKYFDTITNQEYNGTIVTTCSNGASDDVWATD